MVCAFDGPPSIIRVYGRGEAVPEGDDRFAALAARFPPLPGARAVVRVDVDRVSTSCGYGVPLLRYAGERTRLLEWAQRRGEDGLAAYRDEHNAVSIDGLPALDPTRTAP